MSGLCSDGAAIFEGMSVLGGTTVFCDVVLLALQYFHNYV